MAFLIGGADELGAGNSGTVDTIPLWTPDGSSLGDSNLSQDANGDIVLLDTKKLESSAGDGTSAGGALEFTGNFANIYAKQTFSTYSNSGGGGSSNTSYINQTQFVSLVPFRAQNTTVESNKSGNGSINLDASTKSGTAVATIRGSNLGTTNRTQELPDATGTLVIDTGLTVGEIPTRDDSGKGGVWVAATGSKAGLNPTEALTVANTAKTTGALTANTTYQVTVVASGATNVHAVLSVLGGQLTATTTSAQFETLNFVFKVGTAFTPDYTGGLELTPVIPYYGDSIVLTTDGTYSRNIMAGVAEGSQLLVHMTGSTGNTTTIEGEAFVDNGINTMKFAYLGGAWIDATGNGAPWAG